MIKTLKDENAALVTEVETAREGALFYNTKLLEERKNKEELKVDLQSERKIINQLRLEKVRLHFYEKHHFLCYLVPKLET